MFIVLSIGLISYYSKRISYIQIYCHLQENPSVFARLYTQPWQSISIPSHCEAFAKQSSPPDGPLALSNDGSHVAMLLAVTEKMDSRLRGNDKREECGDNEREECGDGGDNKTTFATLTQRLDGDMPSDSSQFFLNCDRFTSDIRCRLCPYQVLP